MDCRRRRRAGASGSSTPRGSCTSRRTDLRPEQKVYAQPFEKVSGWPGAAPGSIIGLQEVVDHVDTSILIGLSTLPGAFTESVVRTVAHKVNRPIILPLSNPTVKAEAKPADLIQWTEGRALVATGSPFAPVQYGGRMIPIAQCNNVYIFPALGLGAVASQSRRVTKGMILASARALAEHSPALKDPTASLLPGVQSLREEVAPEIAIAVGREAQKEGMAPDSTPEALREKILAHRWIPAYPHYGVD